jgi:hypothetical protein
MPRPPVLSGTLRRGGAIELLRELEEKRITGELRFESDDEEGLISFYGGAIAADQELRGDGRDPVDVLLELQGGIYEIHPRLPVLAVSKGDDFVKTGSLAVHVPADLMSYCERGGLTGRLELSHEGQRAEAIYDAGELLAIELDGRGDADLSEVFAWEQGRFRIELDATASERIRSVEDAPTTEYVAVPKKKRDDTRQFLRVVEMALVDVLDHSERARSPTRTSPPMPPPPKARPRPSALPPPPLPRRRVDDHTVRLIYLSGDPPSPSAADTSTRHVAKGSATEVALTDARPERRAGTPHRGATPQPPEPEPMAKQPSKKKKPASETRAPSKVREVEREVEVETADVEASGTSDLETSEVDPREQPRKVEIAAKPPATEDIELPLPTGEVAKPAESGTALEGVAWAIGLLLIGIGILAILAQLPPLE